jgi:hypothetical protein
MHRFHYVGVDQHVAILLADRSFIAFKSRLFLWAQNASTGPASHPLMKAGSRIARTGASGPGRLGSSRLTVDAPAGDDTPSSMYVFVFILAPNGTE